MDGFDKYQQFNFFYSFFFIYFKLNFFFIIFFFFVKVEQIKFWKDWYNFLAVKSLHYGYELSKLQIIQFSPYENHITSVMLWKRIIVVSFCLISCFFLLSFLLKKKRFNTKVIYPIKEL